MTLKSQERQMELNFDLPAIFLGIADHLQPTSAPFPIGGLDLFQISQHKLHLVYPATISSNVWVVIVKTDFLTNCDFSKWKIRVATEADVELGTATFSRLTADQVETTKTDQGTPTVTRYLAGADFVLLHFSLDCVVHAPGRYLVQSSYDGLLQTIGSVHFHYRKAPALTPDQVKAIESDPNYMKAIRIDLGCKFCPHKAERIYRLETAV